MTRTEYYGLNQWQRSDGIRMEDFNADNAAIDAAIHTALSRVPSVHGGIYWTSELYASGYKAELGFEPSAVLMLTVSAASSAIVKGGIYINNGLTTSTALMLGLSSNVATVNLTYSSTGFTIPANNEVAYKAGSTTYYVAFR